MIILFPLSPDKWTFSSWFRRQCLDPLDGSMFWPPSSAPKGKSGLLEDEKPWQKPPFPGLFGVSLSRGSLLDLDQCNKTDFQAFSSHTCHHKTFVNCQSPEVRVSSPPRSCQPWHKATIKKRLVPKVVNLTGRPRPHSGDSTPGNLGTKSTGRRGCFHV